MTAREIISKELKEPYRSLAIKYASEVRHSIRQMHRIVVH
jgi:hypothetical protein